MDDAVGLTWMRASSESWRFSGDLFNPQNPNFERTIRILANSARFNSDFLDMLLLAFDSKNLSQMDRIDVFRAARNFPSDARFENAVKESEYPVSVFGEMLMLHWGMGDSEKHASSVIRYIKSIFDNPISDKSVIDEIIVSLIISNRLQLEILRQAYYQCHSLASLTASVYYSFSVKNNLDNPLYNYFIELIRSERKFSEESPRYAGLNYILKTIQDTNSFSVD